jgi:hypothetical protein
MWVQFTWGKARGIGAGVSAGARSQRFGRVPLYGPDGRPIPSLHPDTEDLDTSEAPTGQRGGQETINSVETLDPMSDFETLNRTSPEKASCGLRKNFCISMNKLRGQLTFHQDRRERQRKSLFHDFRLSAVGLFKQTAERRVSLVTTVESLGDCERELTTLMNDSVEICERSLNEFDHLQGGTNTLIADLRLKLSQVLADAKIMGLDRVETIQKAIMETGQNERHPSEPTKDAGAKDPEVERHQERHKKRPSRGRKEYERIDEALRESAKARPTRHREVFQMLEDRKVWVPRREPFKSAGGWLKGWKADPRLATVWLSQCWSRLGLPDFPRGPQK